MTDDACPHPLVWRRSPKGEPFEGQCRDCMALLELDPNPAETGRRWIEIDP